MSSILRYCLCVVLLFEYVCCLCCSFVVCVVLLLSVFFCFLCCSFVLLLFVVLLPVVSLLLVNPLLFVHMLFFCCLRSFDVLVVLLSFFISHHSSLMFLRYCAVCLFAKLMSGRAFVNC